MPVSKARELVAGACLVPISWEGASNAEGALSVVTPEERPVQRPRELVRGAPAVRVAMSAVNDGASGTSGASEAGGLTGVAGRVSPTIGEIGRASCRERV